MLIYPTLKMAPIQGLIGFGGGATGSLVIGDSDYYDFVTHTFTTGGATGRNGPAHATLVSAYGTSWSSNTNFFVQGDYQGYQKWTVPADGIYEFEVEGASGGKHSYGKASVPGASAEFRGVKVVCRLTLTANDKIQLVVGQKGVDSSSQYATDASEGDNAAPGGGGASWVFVNATDSLPLIVAGAGAGGTRNTYSDGDATTAENGRNSATTLVSSGYALGGTGGNGGRTNADSGSSYWAGAGAGWLTNGTGGNQSTNYTYTPGAEGADGGRNPDNGLIGGARWQDATDSGGDGGFGGGGGGGSDNMGTGGGAGYSGGGGGNSSAPGNAAGGGGGTYVSTNATNVTKNLSTSYNSDGYIKITKV